MRAAPPQLPFLIRERPRPRAAGTRAILAADADYPAALRDLPDAPAELYVRGAWPLPSRAIAIVGSRAATRYGLEIARTLAADLARLGFAIVSGLARGIDAAAHRGALEAAGLTAAVLPGGIGGDSSGGTLAREIERRGALLSEWPAGVPARRGLFIRRNRLIAALAPATVVVEAAERSGALSTAAAARRLKRLVFAVPGDVDRPTSRGTNGLLRSGALMCCAAGDVVRALATRSPAPTAAGPEVAVLAALGDRAASVDAIAHAAALDVPRTLAALLRLQWAGAAVRHPGERWSRGGGGAP